MACCAPPCGTSLRCRRSSMLAHRLPPPPCACPGSRGDRARAVRRPPAPDLDGRARRDRPAHGRAGGARADRLVPGAVLRDGLRRLHRRHRRATATRSRLGVLVSAGSPVVVFIVALVVVVVRRGPAAAGVVGPPGRARRRCRAVGPRRGDRRLRGRLNRHRASGQCPTTRRTRSSQAASMPLDGDPLPLDLLLQHDQLEGRQDRGGEQGQVAVDAELAEQVAHVHVGERHRRHRPGPARPAALMSAAWVRLSAQPGVPEGQQPLHRRCPGPERRRAGRSPRPATAVSEVLSTAAISPSRLSKRRNSVPLPTPASRGTASMVTQSTPRVSTSRSAAARMVSRLRAASARSGGGASASGRLMGTGSG